MVIKSFTATDTALTTVIDDIVEPTTVEFILSDGSAVAAVLIDSSDPLYTYDYKMDASDGVYSVIVDRGLQSELSTTIVNKLVVSQCLLRSVLEGAYDCRLLQELEAVDMLILSSEGELARDIYNEALLKCSQCVDAEVTPLEGISIWVVDDNFIVQ